MSFTNIGFSIVVCSYNPEKEIFQRLLNAVLKFDEGDIEHEIIIVDNNSNPCLQSLDYVNAFLIKKKNASIIIEKTEGLTSARIAGIKHANFDWIVFFDDDNEPDFRYLDETAIFLKSNPKVGICGPGKVDVEFFESKATLKSEKIQNLFQYRNIKENLVENDLFNGKACAFPYGTGMVVKKDILLNYCKQVESGTYTLNDRKGKSLSSGGDTQILYTVIKMGYYAGTGALIKMKHLISSKKTTRKAIIKLLFSINVTHIIAYNEVFPEAKIKVSPVTNIECLKKIYNRIKIGVVNFKSIKSIQFDIAESLGVLKAQVVAGDFEAPIIIKTFEKLIKI